MKKAIIFVGADKIGYRTVNLPRGVGAARFQAMCNNPRRWLTTTDGTKVRAEAVVSFRIEEARDGA